MTNDAPAPLIEVHTDADDLATLVDAGGARDVDVVSRDHRARVADDRGQLLDRQPGSLDAVTQATAVPRVSLVRAGEPGHTPPWFLADSGRLVELAKEQADVVLFDTGAGDAAFADAGRLPQSLQAAGVDAAEVTDVVISHAHGDHVGGLLDGDGQPAFANATVHMSAPEWQALQGDAGQSALATAIASQVEAFEPGAEVLPGVTSLPVEGHTPGHSAYLIDGGTQRLLYIGDSAHHHVISVQRPRWTIQFDGDASAAEASREALLARIADEGLLVSSPHFPYPGLGRIERRDGSFVWVPVE
jgi:glyoxylase-like metal-dependent hydrolase (beta-lactamase superfamily II)